jgi:hypothetical protein
MYSLSIKIGSALWPNMMVSIFETYWYRGELLICYRYSYFVQVNVLSYIKNLQFYSESCKLTGVKYIMHLYKCTCMLKHFKSFIWFRYRMSFLDKS